MRHKLLILSFSLVAGCSSASSITTACHDDPATLSGKSQKYVTRTLLLPANGVPSYAVDVDGDGKPDNQFLRISTTFDGLTSDRQQMINDLVAQGGLLDLLEIRAPDFQTADCAALILAKAAPLAAGDPKPLFDGNDRFQLLNGTAARMAGALRSGKLSTNLPQEILPAEAQHFLIELPVGDGLLPFPLSGVHVSGAVTAGAIMSGQIHGAIRVSDIDQVTVPALATLITQEIHKKPVADATNNLVLLFEIPGSAASTKKCQVAADCCARPENRATCKITADEIRQNPVFAVASMADVQVFDDNGAWAPVPNGTRKDAVSFGMGFTAVPAQF